MKGTPTSAVVTLGELAASEVMSRVQLHGGGPLDQPVTEVRMVTGVEQVRQCRPGTIVVLHGSIASKAWAASIAVRHAWERDVRCVVADLDSAAAPPVIRLADRLKVRLGLAQGNLADLALDLAALMGDPATLRGATVGRCALAVAGMVSVDEILDALSTELGAEVRLVEGRPLLPAGKRPPVVVPLSPGDVARERAFVVDDEGWPGPWRATVEEALRACSAQILAAEAAGAVDYLGERHVARWVVHRVREGSTIDIEQLVRLGWPSAPPLICCFLAADSDGEPDLRSDLALLTSWSQEEGVMVPAPTVGGWVLWGSADLTASGTEREKTEERLIAHWQDTLVRSGRNLPRGLVTGMGMSRLQEGHGDGSVLDDPGLAVSRAVQRGCHQAHIAARAAAQSTADGPLAFSQLAMHQLLTVSDAGDLKDLANEVLRSLVGQPDGPLLVSTLASYLDHGSSVGRSAQALGLHRNTVTARIDRLRSLGVPVDEPTSRLNLHLAARALLMGGPVGVQGARVVGAEESDQDVV